MIKTRFARSVPKAEQLSRIRQTRGERGIWQRRFWEHLIRDEADHERHIEYCYINAVKHALVSRAAIGRIRHFTYRKHRNFPGRLGG